MGTVTEFLVNEGIEDNKRGIISTHILKEYILTGVLVGKGYSPDRSYETERMGTYRGIQTSSAK